jgi:hypothetical protein
MDKRLGDFIIMLIQTIVFMTPVLILFYKQGRKDQVLDEAVKDINGLGTKVSEIREHQAHDMNELKEKMGSIEKSIVRIDTAMDFISDLIKGLKNE